MPQARPIVDPNFHLHLNGAPIQNAVYAFYVSPGSTPAAIYNNPELGASIGSTLTTGSTGRITNIGYADPAVRYKCILTIPGGPTITTDPWITAESNLFDEDTAIEVLDNLFNKGNNIASATTTNLVAASEYFVDVTGTTTIDSFGNLGAGDWRLVRFTGAGTLTYNASTQIIPGAANYTRANGDMAWVFGLGSSSNIVLPFPISGGAVLNSALKPTETWLIAVGDETTPITTGAAKVTFRAPYAFTISSVRGSLSTAQSSGSLVAVDVNDGGASIFSTTLTFDNGEKTTTTAATPAVLSDTSIGDDSEITIDIDTVGAAADARGLKVALIGRRT